MAVHRPQEGCPICGEPFKAIVRPDNPHNPVVGDNFIQWDYSGHKCKWKMKYIFLDLDGVLSLTWSYRQPTENWIKILTPTVEDNITPPFFYPAVEQLNRVLTETDAEIILSSDWRIGYNLQQLDYIFKQNKVNKSPVAVTDNLTGYWVEHEEELHGKHERDIEIEKYVKDNEIENFAIVDDMKINAYSDRFVRTKGSHGLSKNLADQVIKILNG